MYIKRSLFKLLERKNLTFCKKVQIHQIVLLFLSSVNITKKPSIYLHSFHSLAMQDVRTEALFKIEVKLVNSMHFYNLYSTKIFRAQLSKSKIFLSVISI